VRVHAVNAHRARDSVDCHHLQAHARGGSSVYGIQRSMSTSRVYSLPGLRPAREGPCARVERRRRLLAFSAVESR